MRVHLGISFMELVVVLVVLGILAAVAIPNFIEHTKKAHTTGAKGVATAITALSTINKHSDKAGRSDCVKLDSSKTSCAAAATVLLADGIPAGFKISGVVDLQNSAMGSCKVESENSLPHKATLHKTTNCNNLPENEPKHR